MSLTLHKNKTVSAALYLLLWSIVLRLIVYIFLPPDKPIEEYGTGLLFFSALTDHFWDYLSHITYIPPVSYIITGSVFWIFGVNTALHIRAFVMMAGVMDMAAVLLLFNASRKIGIDKKIALPLLCLYSAVLIPFELWREGLHYDHHTIFFVSFFAWALVSLIHKKESYAGMIWVSVAGGLLVAQSAVNSAIVPFSIILILSILYIKGKQFKKLGVALCITLFLPIFFLVMISKKNQAAGGETLTSNKAGPAMMMVVQRSYNYDTAKIRSVIKEFGAPEWYMWAYEHASVFIDTATGKPDNLMLTLSQAFGDCFSTQEPVEKAGPFGFDFHPLLNHLRQDSSLAGFTHLVEEDSVDALHRTYRMAGYSPGLTPRWIGIYGDVSKKIFFKTLLKNPVGMIRAFIIQQGIFSIYGPLFPYNVMKKQTNLLVRGGLRTVRGRIPLDPLFTCFVLAFAIISWITYAFALINIPFTIIRRFMKKGTAINTPENDYFLLLSIPVLLVAGVYSCLVGGENDRYFMQLTPYLILLTILLVDSYKTMRKRFFRNHAADPK